MLKDINVPKNFVYLLGRRGPRKGEGDATMGASTPMLLLLLFSETASSRSFSENYASFLSSWCYYSFFCLFLFIFACFQPYFLMSSSVTLGGEPLNCLLDPLVHQPRFSSTSPHHKYLTSWSRICYYARRIVSGQLAINSALLKPRVLIAYPPYVYYKNETGEIQFKIYTKEQRLGKFGNFGIFEEVSDIEMQGKIDIEGRSGAENIIPQEAFKISKFPKIPKRYVYPTCKRQLE